MKNTKMRKKMLVSSIAMLMVATVSLGSATYAWFSTKTTATAKGLQASTTQASSLVLSETGTAGTWTYDLDYGMSETTLEPVTTNDFRQWKFTTADAYDGGVTTNAPAAIAEGSDDTYYVVKDLYMKNNGAESLEVQWDLDITGAASGDEDFFRVALVKVTDAAADGFVYGNNADDFAKDPTKFTSLTASNVVEGASLSAVTVSDITAPVDLGEIPAGTTWQYRIYMYYEGTDPQCKDTLAVNTNNVKFTFSKKPAAVSP